VQRFLEKAQVVMPDALPRRGVQVATRKKLQARRKTRWFYCALSWRSPAHFGGTSGKSPNCNAPERPEKMLRLRHAGPEVSSDENSHNTW